MPRNARSSPEVRERAVPVLVEHRDEYPSEWAAMTAISAKLGMTPETLRIWVRRTGTDEGKPLGTTTEDQKKIKDLSSGRSKSPYEPTKWQVQVVAATNSANFSDGVMNPSVMRGRPPGVRRTAKGHRRDRRSAVRFLAT